MNIDNKLYMIKEDAKMLLVNALIDYKDKCETYGMSEDEIMDELDNVIYDSGMESFKVVNA